MSQDKVFAERTSALCCRMSLHVVLWLTLLPNDVSVSGEVALALAQSKARTWRQGNTLLCEGNPAEQNVTLHDAASS